LKEEIENGSSKQTTSSSEEYSESYGEVLGSISSKESLSSSGSEGMDLVK
jgi:hypothetical protein